MTTTNVLTSNRSKKVIPFCLGMLFGIVVCSAFFLVGALISSYRTLSAAEEQMKASHARVNVGDTLAVATQKMNMPARVVTELPNGNLDLGYYHSVLGWHCSIEFENFIVVDKVDPFPF